MKKGQIAEGFVTELVFPNKGIASAEDGSEVVVKHTLPGQKVSFAVQKARRGKYEGRLLEVLEKSFRQPEKRAADLRLFLLSSDLRIIYRFLPLRHRQRNHLQTHLLNHLQNRPDNPA